MTSDALSAYRREGYCIFRNVLDDATIQRARDHVDRLMREHPDLRSENLHTGLVRTDPFWVNLVSDDRLLDIAEIFVGPDIALFASHYICKPPREGQPVLWHQDGSYWPLQPMNVVTLWLAIDESTVENGCLRVIPGTQEMRLSATTKRTDVDNVLGSGMDESLVDESRAVDIELQPGDVSVHHPNVIHGSNGNFSEKRRCGLTIRYIPTSTKILRLELAAPFLLRGNAVPGVNEYLAPPGAESAFRART